MVPSGDQGNHPPKQYRKYETKGFCSVDCNEAEVPEEKGSPQILFILATFVFVAACLRMIPDQSSQPAVDTPSASTDALDDLESAFTDAQGYLLMTPSAIPAFKAWNAKFYGDDPDMRECLNIAFAVIGGVTLSQAEATCNNSVEHSTEQHLAAK